jgi:hypothetical protein
MTWKQRIDQHDREIADIRRLQRTSETNLVRLETSMIDLVNQQGETKRSIDRLSRTVDRFIKSMESPRNGRARGAK